MVGWTVRMSPGGQAGGVDSTNGEQKPTVKEYDPSAQTQSHLSPHEQKAYEERYKVLFEQADEDPALAPTIKDIVLAEINISRLQEQQAKVTKKLATGRPTPDDLAAIGAYSKLIKDATDTNLKLLDKLNLTREKKQAAKKVIESTPSRYVSAYERILKNFTPEQFTRAKKEEDEAVARLIRKGPAFESIAQAPERDSSLVDA